MCFVNDRVMPLLPPNVLTKPTAVPCYGTGVRRMYLLSGRLLRRRRSFASKTPRFCLKGFLRFKSLPERRTAYP